jgi:predicted  nucleic acid-binding Zn-ribbon protein
MTQEQFNGRNERAENERLIISLNEEGNFKVYSPAYPTKSYTVSGTEEGPKCTCSDFEGHKNDPEFKCNHMLAVMNLLNKSNEPTAAQNKEPQTMKEETMAEAIRGVEMNISVSRDDKINSLSITLSYPVERGSSAEVKETPKDCSEFSRRAVQAREW